MMGEAPPRLIERNEDHPCDWSLFLAPELGRGIYVSACRIGGEIYRKALAVDTSVSSIAVTRTINSYWDACIDNGWVPDPAKHDVEPILTLTDQQNRITPCFSTFSVI